MINFIIHAASWAVIISVIVIYFALSTYEAFTTLQ
jgi:hypothetical protein